MKTIKVSPKAGFYGFLLCFWLISVMGFGQANYDETDVFGFLVSAEAEFQAFEDFSSEIEVMSLSQQSQHPAKGTFRYKSGKYVMEFEEDLMISDGVQTMTWYKAFGDAQVTNDVLETDMTLRGMYQLYKVPHEAIYVGETDGKMQLKFVAKDPNAIFFKKVLWIGKESGLIEGYELYSRGHGSFIYAIKNIEVNAGLADDLFVIDHEFVRKAQNGEIEPIDVHQGHESHDEHEGHDHGDHEGENHEGHEGHEHGDHEGHDHE